MASGRDLMPIAVATRHPPVPAPTSGAVGVRRAPTVACCTRPDRAALLELQRLAGNRAVTKLLSAPEAPPVQRVRIVSDKRHGWTQAPAKAKNAVETRYATPDERDTYRKALTRNKPLLTMMETEWAQLAVSTTVVSVDDLYAVGALLDAISGKAQRTEADELRLRDIAVLLVKASMSLAPAADDQDYLARELIASYRATVNRLSPKATEGALAMGAADLDLTVSAGEVAAYRADIVILGTWGGLAEAELAAQRLQVSCTIFVVDPAGNYQAIQGIGAGQPYRGRDLLFRVDHYETVAGAANGQPFQAAHVQIPTEADGNCLYEGLLLVLQNVKQPDRRRRALIRRLRRAVAAAITQAQIELSILEVLLSGHAQGMGSSMRAALVARDITAESADTYLQEQGIEPPKQADHAVRKAWQAFLSERTADPASAETATALMALESEADKLPRRKAAPLPKGEGLLSGGRSARVEGGLRAEAVKRHAKSITLSPHNGTQYIVTVDRAEYVLDRLGQLVPRILLRNISTTNEEELRTHKAIWPSGASPVGKPKESRASGTGANVITHQSGEMSHVQGDKPSDFLSATTSKVGALNPQGQEFGTKPGGKKARVVKAQIDLAHIDPVEIRALYTHRGIGYWLLENYAGDKAGILNTLDANSGASGAALAKEHEELSAKEWQALVDVIRTTEVLLSGEIPGAAVKKLGSGSGPALPKASGF
jgi:hypothetical protein